MLARGMTDLRQALSRLNSPGIRVACLPVRMARLEALYPGELKYIARAMAKRRREFVAVRQLARQLLVELGVPPAALPRHADGSPVWPDGVVGSLSHRDDYAFAAVADAGCASSLGCDIEPALPLPRGTTELVLSANERAACAAGAPAWQDRLVFCAKEAFYKAQYPLARCYLDFADVAVTIDRARSTFTVRLLRHAGALPAGKVFHGRYVHASGYLATLVTLAPLA